MSLKPKVSENPMDSLELRSGDLRSLESISGDLRSLESISGDLRSLESISGDLRSLNPKVSENPMDSLEPCSGDLRSLILKFKLQLSKNDAQIKKLSSLGVFEDDFLSIEDLLVQKWNAEKQLKELESMISQ